MAWLVRGTAGGLKRRLAIPLRAFLAGSSLPFDSGVHSMRHETQLAVGLVLFVGALAPFGWVVAILLSVTR